MPVNLFEKERVNNKPTIIFNKNNNPIRDKVIRYSLIFSPVLLIIVYLLMLNNVIPILKKRGALSKIPSSEAKVSSPSANLPKHPPFEANAKSAYIKDAKVDSIDLESKEIVFKDQKGKTYPSLIVDMTIFVNQQLIVPPAIDGTSPSASNLNLVNNPSLENLKPGDNVAVILKQKKDSKLEYIALQIMITTVGGSPPSL